MVLGFENTPEKQLYTEPGSQSLCPGDKLKGEDSRQQALDMTVPAFCTLTELQATQRSHFPARLGVTYSQQLVSPLDTYISTEVKNSASQCFWVLGPEGLGL